jgi:hypothetical protein
MPKMCLFGHRLLLHTVLLRDAGWAGEREYVRSCTLLKGIPSSGLVFYLLPRQF